MEELIDDEVFYSDHSKEIDSDEVWNDIQPMISVDKAKENWEKLMEVIIQASMIVIIMIN